MNCSVTLLSDIVGGCHETLITGRCPEIVTAYLQKERGLLHSTLKLFEVGFCTKAMEKVINREYYDNKIEKPNIPEDFIVDKIIVPIKNDCGKLVAFATRSIGKGQSWWNTPFTKGDCIFGLDKARSKVFQNNKLYVVEGYMDQMYLFQSGLMNVGAVMGTRFTMIQAGLALRYCDQLCLVFDADVSDRGKGAGQKAAETVYDLAKDFFRINIIKLPIKIDQESQKQKGVDPDEYVMQYGLPSLLSLETEIKERENSNVVGFRNGYR